jgi:hypothetical protein
MVILEARIAFESEVFPGISELWLPLTHAEARLRPQVEVAHVIDELGTTICVWVLRKQFFPIMVIVHHMCELVS